MRSEAKVTGKVREEEVRIIMSREDRMRRENWGDRGGERVKL